jgi:hypothetical protein
MIKITTELEKLLTKEIPRGELGIVCEFGAVVGDAQFIIYFPDVNFSDVYLAHISEFEQKGVLIRLKEKEKENV